MQVNRASRVEERRGGLGRSASLRFPSPLIEPDLPISGIRLSDWLAGERETRKPTNGNRVFRP
jgi:hypothetical protein